MPASGFPTSFKVFKARHFFHSGSLDLTPFHGKGPVTLPIAGLPNSVANSFFNRVL